MYSLKDQSRISNTCFHGLYLKVNSIEFCDDDENFFAIAYNDNGKFRILFQRYVPERGEVINVKELDVKAEIGLD